MRSRRRWIIVGLVAVCGVLCVALGIQGLGKLLEAGKIPERAAHRDIRVTVDQKYGQFGLGTLMPLPLK